MLLIASGVVVLALAAVSVFVGAADVTPWGLLAAGPESREALYVVAARIPRTLAIVLTGVSMAIAGLIMQLLTRNRFVEPTTAGTVDAALLGLTMVMLLAPAIPAVAKAGVASLFALVGTGVFMLLLRRIPVRSVILVPIVGIMFGGVIGSATTFLAYRFELMSSLNAWTIGDFSGVLRGRYELLWIAAAVAVVAWVAADRFTVAGMGDDIATGLGLDSRRVLLLGLTVVAVITGVVVGTTGTVPFLGLVVPNIVSRIVGDNMRRAVPWVAVLGAGFLLACDIVGRLVRFPYEIPMSIVVGVVGAGLFLVLLLRRPAHG